MKKKLYRKLDIVWRIVGVLLLILFIYDIYIPNRLSFIVVGFIILYAIISAIVFLPPILTKFFRKFKKRILKK